MLGPFWRVTTRHRTCVMGREARYLSSSSFGTSYPPARGECGFVPLSREQCFSLYQNGYVVVDDALPPVEARRCRDSIQDLYKNQKLYRNATHFVTVDGTKLLHKAGIYETELMFREVCDQNPDLARVFEDLTLLRSLNQHILELRLGFQSIKAQYNAGNRSCFPLHFDSDPSVDSRQVTAILYLNEEWQEGDGGELALFPVPYEPIYIPPLFNRLVLFSSQSILHRVLPSLKERYCLTLWLYRDQDNDNSTVDKRIQVPKRQTLTATLDEDGEFKKILQFLLQPNLRRHFIRASLAAPWAQSITESHPPGERDVEAAVERFWEEVKMIENVLEPLLKRAGSRWTLDEIISRLPLQDREDKTGKRASASKAYQFQYINWFS